MKRICVLLLIGAVALNVAAGPAFGVSAFKKGFEAKYRVKEPKTDAEKTLAEAASKAKCYVCHVKGEKKEVRNAYGDALAKFLDEDDFKKERIEAEPDKTAKEISDALEKAESMKSPGGGTFGELIEAGKLPVAAEK